MRLRRISTLEDANAFVPEFIKDYNARFSVKPTNEEDAHRPLFQDEAALRRILSVQSKRKLTKNLEASFEGKTYQIKTQTTGYRLRFKEVTIHEHIDGSTEILCDGKPLVYQVLAKAPRVREANSKAINGLIDEMVDAEKKKAACSLHVLPTGPTAPPQLSC